MDSRKFTHKLLASVLKRFHILVSDGYSVGTAYGARFLFDWRHSLDKKVAVELYEYPQISYLRACAERLQPQMFLDIGAHAALYSLIMKTRFPDIEVHAFEPDRTNLCQLYANLFVNGLTRDIQVHEHGISDHSGFASFEDSAEHSSRGTRRISDSGENRIPIETLDDVMDVRDRRIVLKIDIEGHELAALAGARRLLSGNQCLLQVESAPKQVAQVTAMLEEMGYRHLATIYDHFFTNIEGFAGPES